MPRDVPGFDLASAAVRNVLVAPEPFASLPPAVQAAVNAYDQRRRAFSGRNEPPMSDANKAHIAPMIVAAIVAYADASK